MHREDYPQPGELPEAPLVTRKRHIPLVWLIPLIAVALAMAMVIHSWASAGPTFTVTFAAAEGLEAGKTHVKFKDVVVGTVDTVTLSEDHTKVIATVTLVKTAKSMLKRDTRFWIVRPHIGASGISGIDTLLSGIYIGMDPGTSSSTGKHFVGLEDPPMVTNGEAGRIFILEAKDLGSINVGSPLYFRHIEVGRVASYVLNPDKSIFIKVFVRAPFDEFVSASTRFWNASGVDVSVTAAGLKVNTQSLATILAGGIAFDDPPEPNGSMPVAANTMFALSNDRKSAMADPDGAPIYMQMRFAEGLRGLEPQAPVEFVGVNIGNVTKVKLDYDPNSRKFSVVVGVVIYSQRLGAVLNKLPTRTGRKEALPEFIASLVHDGLRAQARTGNLLTGQLYVALDFMPHAAPAPFDESSRPLVIPTVPGDLDHLQEQLASTMAKIQKIPFDSIGRHIDEDTFQLGVTLKKINASTLPQAARTMGDLQHVLHTANDSLAPDSSLQLNLNQLLSELTRTAASFRVLSDMLINHPESLIRGRSGGAPAPVPAPGSGGAK